MQVFDFMFRPLKTKMATYYGEQYAQDIVIQSRLNFEEIIPQLPYVGGMKNYYTPILVVNGMIIAMYRAMAGTGKTEEDVVNYILIGFAVPSQCIIISVYASDH